MLYKCTLCKYETLLKSDFSRHSQTNKHKNNVETGKKIKMEEEQQKIESEKQIYVIKMEYELKLAQKELQIAQTEIKCIKEYDKKIEKITEIAKINSETARASTSALSFIIKNYSNAPNIKTYDEFAFLKETDLYKLADKIVYKHKHKSLTEFISKLLLKFYKKDNPGEQSIWNTDVSRLSYTVKNDNNKKKISKWIIDKKGSTLSSYAIKPMLDKIKERIEEAEKYINNDINVEVKYRQMKIDGVEGVKYKSPTKYSLATKQEILLLCHAVKNDIENSEYAKDILRYIANHFYLADRE